MDLIKLYSTTSNKASLTFGQAVNGWTSVLWVERYQKAGEFKIEAPLSSGLRNVLPVGSFVSHLETSEVMMVEDHQIKQKKDEDGTITITGRSLFAFLEHRIIGDGPASTTNTRGEYIYPAGLTWVQVVAIIDAHMISGQDSNNDVPGIAVTHTCSGTGTSEERNIQYEDVYSELVKILKIDDIGVKTIRPTAAESDTVIEVYQGEDRTNRVRLSWVAGDLDDIQYLFSSRSLKNYARVVGRWVQVRVAKGAPTGFDRRTMVVDASDMDNPQQEMPTGLALTWIVAAMTIRGKEALANQDNTVITQVDVSPNARYRYRTDYNLGDLVTVDGDFGASEVMRVIEYAESVDENGTVGTPSLAIPGGE